MEAPACASAPAPYQGQGQHPELSPSARPGLRAHSQSRAHSVLLPARLGGASFCIRPSDGGAHAPRVRWGLQGGVPLPHTPPTLCPWLSPVTPNPQAPPLLSPLHTSGQAFSLGSRPIHRLSPGEALPGTLSPELLSAGWQHHRSSPASPHPLSDHAVLTLWAPGTA